MICFLKNELRKGKEQVGSSFWFFLSNTSPVVSPEVKYSLSLSLSLSEANKLHSPSPEWLRLRR